MQGYTQKQGPLTWSNKLVQHRVVQQETVSIHDTKSLRKLQSLGKRHNENMSKAACLTEESANTWSSLVVLVRKKDGSLCFCVDYRKLNDVRTKGCCWLPRIDDTLDTLARAKWFSRLDRKSGYWQVALHPKDKDKAAYSTGQGLCQLVVMPFGLCNAPATFE